MAANDMPPVEAEKELWKHLHKLRAGMLGLQDFGRKMQPMTHYVDEQMRALWFIAPSDTELVREIGLGGTAHFTIQSTDQDFYAALTGAISQSENEEKLDEIWSAGAAAFFEGGREDHRVTLLEMALRDAELWSTTDSSFVFGLEIARATLGDKSQPDIGSHQVLDFVGAR